MNKIKVDDSSFFYLCSSKTKIMKIRNIITTIGVLLVTTTAFPQSLLWRVSGKDMKSQSYLYGTIHIQDRRVFAFDSAVWRCFDGCDAIAVELLLDQIDFKAVREKMYMPEGQSLAKLLSKDEYRILDSLCKAKLGAGALFFSGMKPFFLMSAIQQADLPKDEPLPLDMFLLKKARDKGMVCHGLEDYMEQIKAVDAVRIDDQLDILRQVLRAEQDLAVSFDSLVLLYLDFNMEKIAEMMDDPTLPDNFSKSLVEKRNKVMLKGFRKIARKENVFCAVGCAHLIGNTGLIAQLRKRGYVVEPVPMRWIE